MTRSWTQNPSGIYVETFTPSPPSPLAELDAPFGNFATIDAILGRLNGTIVVQHASGSPTVYQPSANTDAARGTAFLAALAAAASGDVLYLAAMTYDCVANQIIIPGGVIIQGADKVGDGRSHLLAIWQRKRIGSVPINCHRKQLRSKQPYVELAERGHEISIHRAVGK